MTRFDHFIEVGWSAFNVMLILATVALLYEAVSMSAWMLVKDWRL